MIRVAIIEDEDVAAQTLEKYLKTYEQSSESKFEISRYKEAISFLESYQGYDLVFMDIQMPMLDGFQASQKLREKDREVKIIFVTNMAQYAVKGYEVEAIDFIVKPISYKDFCFKLMRAIRAIEMSKEKWIYLTQGTGMVRVNSRELRYVEVTGHDLIYHTQKEKYKVRGTMKKAEVELKEWGFLRCNHCYLVNPQHIEWVKNYMVKVGNDELQISHPRKKQFMQELGDWYARGGN